LTIHGSYNIGGGAENAGVDNGEVEKDKGMYVALRQRSMQSYAIPVSSQPDLGLRRLIVDFFATLYITTNQYYGSSNLQLR